MHLMIDLETLSTAPTAVVTQLGWCLFDPRAENVQAYGCLYLNPDVQIKNGLTVDWGTIAWWLKQDEASRSLMARPTLGVILPSEALVAVTRLFEARDVDGVWSHGACFDVAIVENLYRRANVRVPWDFRQVRDTRTLFWLAGPSLIWAKNDQKHSAEADAVCQALTVQRAIKLIDARRDDTIVVRSDGTTDDGRRPITAGQDLGEL